MTREIDCVDMLERDAYSEGTFIIFDQCHETDIHVRYVVPALGIIWPS